MNEINEINEDLNDIYVVNITQPPEHQFHDINTSLNVELVVTLKPDACWKHSGANSVVDAFQVLVEPWMFSGTFFSEGTWVPITMGAKSKMSENQGTSGS